MSYHLDDTIVAIATAAGGAARGMVRVSGMDALRLAGACFSAADGRCVADCLHCEAIPGDVEVCLSEGTRQRAPADLFVWPTSRSYTREPVAEIHTTGSPPLLDAILAEVCRAGARLAEPGEFTLRAFLAGRLDLTQAEAVLGVIDSRGGEELRAALMQLAGGLARPLDQLRNDLLQLLAELEAGLDFVDEDIEFVSRGEVLQRLTAGAELIGQVDEQMKSRLTAASANRVVLIGEPNVGKSSLFNALVANHATTGESTQRTAQQAIVSPTRGTTRDYLTATIDLDGVRCELVDTAGLEPQGDGGESRRLAGDASIEEAAQSQSLSQARRAVIRVLCIDAVDAESRRACLIRGEHFDLIACTKADLLATKGLNGIAELVGDESVVVTSSRTGEGLDELCGALRSRLTRDGAPVREIVGATADRCGESIRLAGAATARGIDLATSGGADELVAVEIRAALNELGKVVGVVYTDDVLDRIFKTFCIGK